METIFGIFKELGNRERYGENVVGIGLYRLNTPLFNSMDDAVNFINESVDLPSNESYFIIPITKYVKPVPRS